MLLLDDDTRMLRDSAERFFAAADATKRLRRCRDSRDLVGAARGQWDGMVALGFAGILVPEEFGGAGLGSEASIQVAEMMGHALAAGPFVSSAVMAATAIRDGGNDRVKAEMLPAIATGAVVALAVDETGRHNPAAIETTARRDGDLFRLSGRKRAVIDGNIAETLIVVARDNASAQLLMLRVDADAPGVALTAHMGLDSRPMVDIAFEDTAARDLVCEPGRTAVLLEHILDAGRLHLAAEMLGAADAVFQRTIAYLKTRVQFGRKIGEFQALQHRAAILFGELEIARSTLLKAVAIQTPEFVSMAKAKIGEVARRATAEAIQMHGGIGVTDDFDLGFFLKRVRVASELLGDSAFHVERYARLQGL
jgi:acyl-CoA dehydrogenase